MRETFPHKKPGDSLSADHINRLSNSANKFEGKVPSRGSSGINSGGVFYENHPTKFRQYCIEITNRKNNADDTETSGLYLGKIRYYSFDDSEWKSSDAEWEVDSRDTFMRFEVADDATNRAGHRIQAYWDDQRAAFIPIARVWPPQERKVVISESGGIAAGASGIVSIWVNDAVSDPLETAEAWFNWMAAGTAGEDAEAMIRWIDDEDKWVIVELEC